MKRLIAAAASSLYIVSVSAAGVYQGLAEGNPDLYPDNASAQTSEVQARQMTGVQPGVGDVIDIYGSFDDGNGDLFSGSKWPGGSGEPADVYHGFKGNPDLL